MGYAVAVVTCEIKLFQNYFTGLLQAILVMNILHHVHCRRNNFEINFRTASVAEIILFQFQMSMVTCEIQQ